MAKHKVIGVLVLLGAAFLTVSGCSEDNRSVEELTESEFNALIDCTKKRVINTPVEDQLRLMLKVLKEKGASVSSLDVLFNEAIRESARESAIACAGEMELPVVQKCLKLPAGVCKP